MKKALRTVMTETELAHRLSLGGYIPPFDFYSRGFTIGPRWDILPNLMLRVEYQSQHGTYLLSFRENPDPNDLVESWDAFAASISVRF